MIKVYYANVASFQNEDAFENYSSKIEEERRNKILRTRNSELRVRSLATGVLLHKVICRWLGQEQENTLAFHIGYEKGGKPYLLDYPQVHYNLSHSGDYVCCAISEQPVGVDIQKHVDYKEAVAARFFSQEDNQLLKECNEQERSKLFFQMWCRKESYGKLTGKGLGQSLDKFEIDWEQDAAIDATSTSMTPAAYYQELDGLQGYSLCVCYEQPEQEIIWEEYHF